jgi:hypothetical protein
VGAVRDGTTGLGGLLGLLGHGGNS